jgi:hypothetical protein
VPAPPPEDCGGAPGYAHLCATIANPDEAEEYAEELLDWFGDLDPEAFDPAGVKFHSAARRLKALSEER